MPEAHALRLAVQRLSEILGQPVVGPTHGSLARSDSGTGAMARWGDRTFALQWMASGGPRHVHAGIRRMKQAAGDSTPAPILLLVVPYMSPAGRRRCAEAEVNWLDLSGNASIRAPDLVVHVEGHKNRFPRPGRPESAFGPRGSRLARRLLLEPHRCVPQSALVQLTGLDPGYVSRVLAKLIDMGLAERGLDGIQATDPDRLLDAWADEYRFDKHWRLAGHVTPAGRDSVTEVVSQVCTEHDLPYALTGLGSPATDSPRCS